MKRAHASGRSGPAFAPFGALRGPRQSDATRDKSAAELLALIDAGHLAASCLDRRTDVIAVRARELLAARGKGR